MHDTFYRVPTQEASSGAKSYVLVNPDQVVGLRPSLIKVGNEYPSLKEVRGTAIIFVGGWTLFTPLPPAKTAELMEIGVAGEEAEGANA